MNRRIEVHRGRKASKADFAGGLNNFLVIAEFAREQRGLYKEFL